MNPQDHVTQTEIRLATIYAIHLETELLMEKRNQLDKNYVRKMEDAWQRRDSFLNALTEVAQHDGHDLGLIFAVAKEICEEAAATTLFVHTTDDHTGIQANGYDR